MDLIRYQDSLHRWLIRPKDNKDIPIFEHCINGPYPELLMALGPVTEEEYYLKVRPLLHLHGIQDIAICNLEP